MFHVLFFVFISLHVRIVFVLCHFLLVGKIMLDLGLVEVLDFGLDCVMFLSKVVFCLFCYSFCNEIFEIMILKLVVEKENDDRRQTSQY